MRFASLLAAALLLGACSDSNSTPDASGDSAPEAASCPSPGPISVVEGGRFELLRLGVWADPSTSFEGGGGLVFRVDDNRVVAYVDYDIDRASLRVDAPGCSPIELDIQVRAMRWETLSEWEQGTTAGPPAREYGAQWLGSDMLPGRDDEALYVFGGFHYQPAQFTPAHDLWRFDFGATRWEEITTVDAPMQTGGRIAAFPGGVVYHGGGSPRPDGSLDVQPSFHALDGESFVWTAIEGSAPPAYTGALIRDAAHDRWIAVCGVSPAGVNCASDTYSQADGWSRLFIPEGDIAPGRFGFHYAYDAPSERIIVAAGQGETEPIGDTWALDLSVDPPRWERLFEEDPQVKRRNGAFAYDPEGRRLFLWGGTPDGRTSSPGLSILRTEPGFERWDHVTSTEDPIARTSGFGVYDAHGPRILFGLGNGDNIYTDLYQLIL